MAGRVSQEVVEAEVSATPLARISQEVVEAEVVATPLARVSQEILEAEVVATPLARVSQEVVEAEVVATPLARISQLVVECLIANIEVFMPIVFPTLQGIGYSVFWKPKFFNLPTQTASSGADIDLGLSQAPLHDFELTYDFLRDSFQSGTLEFKTMLGFFLAVSGNLGRFLFRNPDDNTVKSQAIGTTDGSTRLWTLVRTFGVGEYSGTEPIGYVDETQPFNLYLNGVLQDPSTYTVLTTQGANQQVQFAGVPSAGKAITVDMSYFYYCKLADDNLSFEKFMSQLWLLKKIVLHSCRAGA
jgi:hypothetical protein